MQQGGTAADPVSVLGQPPGRRCDIARRRRPGSGKRGGYKKKPPQHKVICSACGQEIVTSVRPPPGQDLTCLSCVYADKRASAGSTP